MQVMPGTFWRTHASVNMLGDAKRKALVGAYDLQWLATTAGSCLPHEKGPAVPLPTST